MQSVTSNVSSCTATLLCPESTGDLWSSSTSVFFMHFLGNVLWVFQGSGTVSMFPLGLDIQQSLVLCMLASISVDVDIIY